MGLWSLICELWKCEIESLFNCRLTWCLSEAKTKILLVMHSTVGSSEQVAQVNTPESLFCEVATRYYILHVICVLNCVLKNNENRKIERKVWKNPCVLKREILHCFTVFLLCHNKIFCSFVSVGAISNHVNIVSCDYKFSGYLSIVSLVCILLDYFSTTGIKSQDLGLRENNDKDEVKDVIEKFDSTHFSYWRM